MICDLDSQHISVLLYIRNTHEFSKNNARGIYKINKIGAECEVIDIIALANVVYT